MAGSVKKDGTSWYYIVELGRDLRTGKRKQKKKRGFKTKKEAQTALTHAESEILKGDYSEPSKILFGDYLDLWLNDKKTRIKTSTYGTYYWLVTNYIKKGLGHIQISKLTPMLIQQYYNELITNRSIVNENIQKIHSLINNSLNRALRWGLINKNVASLVDRPRSTKREISVWTLEQIHKFLHESDTDPLAIAFHIAITSGMRQSEILGLRWKDIDFTDNYLSVVQSLSHDGKTMSVGSKTKSGTRKIHLPIETMEMLRKNQRIQENDKKHYTGIYQDHGLVVCTSVGTPVNPRNLMRTFYRLTKSSKLPRIRFHDLRHTHATLLLKQGVNPKIVAERLGHADVRITLDTYSHLLPSMQLETANNFGKMFYGEQLLT